MTIIHPWYGVEIPEGWEQVKTGWAWEGDRHLQYGSYYGNRFVDVAPEFYRMDACCFLCLIRKKGSGLLAEAPVEE